MGCVVQVVSDALWIFSSVYSGRGVTLQGSRPFGRGSTTSLAGGWTRIWAAERKKSCRMLFADMVPMFNIQ